MIVVVFAAGCGGSSPTEPTAGGVKVSGHVLAFTTNAGVPGATVIFDRSAPVFNGAWSVPDPAAPRTVTDANGFFNLMVPAIGEYWAWVDGEPAGEST